MTDPLIASAGAVAKKLVELLADDEFRLHLRQLAQAILDTIPEPSTRNQAAAVSSAASAADASAAWTEVPSVTTKAEIDNAVNADFDATAASVATGLVTPAAGPRERILPAAEAVQMLALGRNTNTSGTPPLEPMALGRDTWRRETSQANPAGLAERLRLIRQRCLMKQEGSRWAAERRRRISNGADFATEIDPQDRDIIARAKEIDSCFLWMNYKTGPEPRRIDDFDDLADAFGAMAAIANVMLAVLESDRNGSHLLSQAAELFAEAQSMLRVCIRNIGWNTDSEQKDAFEWLRTFTHQESILVQRYMRIDDEAEPAQLETLRQRIDVVDAKITKSSQSEKERHKRLNQIRYEARKVLSDPASAATHLATIGRVIDELLTGGLPPSHIPLRELLLPVVDQLENAEELPDSVMLVVREIDRYLSLNPNAEQADNFATTLSDDVSTVAGLLRGKTGLMIGGELRRPKKQSIEQAFQLQELIWKTTREHSPHDIFDADIRRQEVAFVLIAIRWSSHSYGKLEALCREHGKPMIRLPRGSHPNQIAMEIMQQAFDRLGGVHEPVETTAISS